MVIAVVLVTASAEADAPPGRYGWTTNLVLDRRTNLNWQRSASTTACGGDGLCTIAEALTYCDGLILEGKSNWRLPTMLELTSLLDLTRRAPALDPTAFPSAPSDAFWTSTHSRNATQTRYVVDFTEGSSAVSHGYTPDTEVHRVRCVY